MKKLKATLLKRIVVTASISGLFLITGTLTAAPIAILNPGLEDPAMENVANTSFSGIHGISTGVPGWYSNEPHNGGAIRIDYAYPGRTGNNVLYIHGSGDQNFYTANFDLGVDLQSHTSYTLTFDVIRWAGVTLDDYVTFRAGVYTGATYEERSSLAEISGDFYLLDDDSNPLNAKTVTLTFTTADVALGTKFWIGGDAFGAGGPMNDAHRAHFDNFAMQAILVPEPSGVLLGLIGLGALSYPMLRRKIKSALFTN